MKESRIFYLFSEFISSRRQPFWAQNQNGVITESPVIYAQKMHLALRGVRVCVALELRRREGTKTQLFGSAC